MNWSRQDTRALIEAATDRPCISIGAVKTIRRHYAEIGLVERMARFERFVGETDATPHVWGVSDCSLLIADWAIANGLPDPASDLRATYSSEKECRALLASRGGLLAVVGACALSIGLKPIQEPQFGAVAVIGSIERQERQWSAIWNGHRWMVRWVSADGRPMWSPFLAKPISIWKI